MARSLIEKNLAISLIMIKKWCLWFDKTVLVVVNQVSHGPITHLPQIFIKIIWNNSSSSSVCRISLTFLLHCIKEKEGESKGVLIQEGHLFDVIWHAKGWVLIKKWHFFEEILYYHNKVSTTTGKYTNS